MRRSGERTGDEVIADESASFRHLPAGWYRDGSDTSLARYWDGTTMGEERREVDEQRTLSTPAPPILLLAPPGWFPDPMGAGIRYWNGSGWTDRTQTLELAPETVSASAAASHRSHTGMRATVAAGSAAVIAALAITGAVSYMDKKPVELSSNRSSNDSSKRPVSETGGPASPPPQTAASSGRDSKRATGCPTGSPLATVSVASQLESGSTDSWYVTLTGKIANKTTSSIQPFYVEAQLLGTGGAEIDHPFLLAEQADSDLGVGRSISVSGQDGVLSATAPTLGHFTVHWTWFNLQFASCPSNP
jgi:hypothetical protein